MSADFSADLLLPSEEQAEAAQLRKANTEALRLGKSWQLPLAGAHYTTSYV